MRLFGVCAIVALSLSASTVIAAAANAADPAPAAPATPATTNTPSVQNLIFEQKHLTNVDQGTALGYRFNRVVSDAQLLGLPFSDDITIKVVNAKPTGEKDVDLQIYTGERARDLQKLTNTTINPVFVVYFDLAVNTFTQLTGEKYGYLKTVFTHGFKDKSKIEPVKLAYKGKTVDGYRIVMTPYVGDPKAGRMQGYDGATFTMVLSDQVPGEIVQLTSVYQSTVAAAPKLEESITIDGAEVK
jgi:hypothetical protein